MTKTGHFDKNGIELKDGDLVKTYRGRTYEVCWSELQQKWLFKDVKPIEQVNESFEIIKP